MPGFAELGASELFTHRTILITHYGCFSIGQIDTAAAGKSLNIRLQNITMECISFQNKEAVK